MNKNLLLKISFYVGIFGMVSTVSGTFVMGGSLLQKVLFLIGASILTATAFISKHKMYSALEVIVVIGTVLAFFSSVSTYLRYVIMLLPAIFAIVYLLKVKYFHGDKFGIVGGIGLVLLACGFATDALLMPVVFYSLLFVSALFLALYSLLQIVFYRTKIAWLWMILNIVFAFGPAINLIKMFG